MKNSLWKDMEERKKKKEKKDEEKKKEKKANKEREKQEQKREKKEGQLEYYHLRSKRFDGENIWASVSETF